ncbi:MAG: SPOR domain-containing protein [Acidobacteriia bacterium]|nr:SPOR domain-containing protein [Methyloceanibacter sp.]MBX5471343.1 SPOR domain-containing protein [Acetobacteraceae bacterium]MCL6491663.1 SPOR domain-containing protein [Terriglobia bacterium]
MTSEVRKGNSFSREELEIPPPTYRIPRRGGMDPTTKRLALTSGAIGAVLLLFLVAWNIGGSPSGVPVIAPENGPIRVKPQDAGGMKIAEADSDILSGQGDDGAAHLAASAEKPAPQMLERAEGNTGGNSGAGTAESTAASGTETTSPVEALAAQPQTSSDLNKPSNGAVSPGAPSPQMGPGTAVAAGAGLPHGSQATPNTGATAATPAKIGATRSEAFSRNQEVQLASLPTEAAARAEWERLLHKFPELLRNRKPIISRVELQGRTFWRVRTDGFASYSDAEGFCRRLRAKAADCAVARF